MRMCAFTLKGATRRGERAGERKNVRSDQEVRILGSHRMPINTLGGDGNFRCQICAGECDSLRCKSTKGDARTGRIRRSVAINSISRPVANVSAPASSSMWARIAMLLRYRGVPIKSRSKRSMPKCALNCSPSQID